MSKALDGVRRDAAKMEYSPGFLDRVAKEYPKMFQHVVIPIGTLTGEAKEVADRQLAASIVPIPYKPPSPELLRFIQAVEDMTRLEEAVLIASGLTPPPKSA